MHSSSYLPPSRPSLTLHQLSLPFSTPCLILFILIDLWSQIILNMPRLPNRILHHNRHLRTHTQNNRRSQTSRLGKKVEVPQRKRQLHRLIHLNHNLLLILLRSTILTNENVPRPEIARNGEFYSLFGAGDGAGVSEDLEVADDALEFGGGHLDGAFVFGVGDAELFVVNVHEFEFKISNPILSRTLKHQRQRIPLVLRPQRDHIIIPRALQNLAHIRSIEPQRNGTIASKVIESSRAEGHGHEGHVGVVHCLDGDFIVGAVYVGLLD
mmetsp:Transcript_2669/g.6140  ORF Transcript_2669/g.6140 Transcript_2669/m.6140 type:complete len:268 (-) Transcript_2669:107-910(-)